MKCKQPKVQLMLLPPFRKGWHQWIKPFNSVHFTSISPIIQILTKQHTQSSSGSFPQLPPPSMSYSVLVDLPQASSWSSWWIAAAPPQSTTRVQPASMYLLRSCILLASMDRLHSASAGKLWTPQAQTASATSQSSARVQPASTGRLRSCIPPASTDCLSSCILLASTDLLHSCILPASTYCLRSGKHPLLPPQHPIVRHRVASTTIRQQHWNGRLVPSHLCCNAMPYIPGCAQDQQINVSDLAYCDILDNVLVSWVE